MVDSKSILLALNLLITWIVDTLTKQITAR